MSSVALPPLDWRFGVALIVLAFLGASNFGLSLFGRMPFVAVVAVAGLIWLATAKGRADWLVVGFGVSASVLCAANLLANGAFNFVIFVPVCALLLLATLGERNTTALRTALDLISFVVLPLLIGIELVAKLSTIDVPVLDELLWANAPGNVYLMRAQSPFSSPLSLSSLLLALFIAYLFFLRSVPRAAMACALVLFTGSRLQALLMLATLLIFIVQEVRSGRRSELWPSWQSVVRTILPMVLALGTILVLDGLVESFWAQTAGRVFGLASPSGAEMAMSGRQANWNSAVALLGNAADVFLVGTWDVPAHDSAFLQIAWKSGILSALLFFGLFLVLLFRTGIALHEKLWIAAIFSISAALVGDTVTPAVSVVYFTVLLLFQRPADPVRQ